MTCAICKTAKTPWSYRICEACAARLGDVVKHEWSRLQSLYKERGSDDYTEGLKGSFIRSELYQEWQRHQQRARTQRFEDAFNAVKLAMRGGSPVRGQGDYLEAYCDCL